jgi:outer membrane receptor protein involved in Fe transport
MTYVAYKTGYKSGGTSTAGLFTQAYINDPALLTFRPEKAQGFEVGVKGEFFDPALRFDIAAYRYTFSDLQLSVINTALNSYFVTNAGKARTTGVEGSLTWRATTELTINTSAAYNRGKYVSFQNAQCYPEIYGTAICPGGPNGSYDRSGQPLPRAPEYSFDGGFTYTKPIGHNLKAQIGGQAIYTRSYWTSETGAIAGIQHGFWRLNADARLGAIDDRWEIAVIGRNLTDEYYRLITADATLGFPGQYGAYMARPREVVVQLTGKF